MRKPLSCPSTLHRSTLLSRADLLACVWMYGAEDTAAWAQALGYSPEPLPPPSPAPAESELAREPAPLPSPAPSALGERPQLRLHRVVHYEALSQDAGQMEAPEWFLHATPWQEDDPTLSADPQAVPAAQLPLMPWSRL